MAALEEKREDRRESERFLMEWLMSVDFVTEDGARLGVPEEPPPPVKDKEDDEP